MIDDKPSNIDRSINIGGNAASSIIQTGDNNSVVVNFQQACLPQPESVNIQEELAALRIILGQLETLDQRKIVNAIEDAEEELKKSDPDKNEIGQALNRALNYAQKANGFTEAIDKLRPHVEAAAGWLGKHSYKLLSLVGLAL